MDPTAQTRATTSRWGPAAGVASAVLMLYALLPTWPSEPAGDAPDAVWQALMANATNRVGIIASALAATAAGILFVAFMAGLRQRGLLARGDGLAALGYGCGLLFVMGMFATFCTWAAVPGMIQLAGNPVPPGDVIRLSFALGAAFVALPVPLCAGAFAIAVARDAARTRAIPRSLGTAGMVVGAAQVVGVFYFPLWLFPVWVASVGAVLLWRPSTQRRTTAAQAEATP